MRINLFYVLSLTMAVACSKKNDPAVLQDGKSRVIKDLMGDTSATVGGGGTGSFRPLYFSFTKNDSIVVATSDKASLKWDLAFTGPYNSEVYVNSGTDENNPGYGGPGKGAVIVANVPYDDVDMAPSYEAFESSAISKIGWDSPGSGGIGWFFYSLDNHICVPVKNRTFLIRTASGRYAKLEILNIYKGNPPVVTDLFWPSPYLTFRYFVQEDGSRVLRTR